jgi:hypothetical protein
MTRTGQKNTVIVNTKRTFGFLPSDEWKLLVYYYRELNKVGIKGRFYVGKLAGCLRGENKVSRIKNATDTLNRRDLIVSQDQGDAITIGLTLEGYDLAIKYSTWFTRSGLRFAEYKGHWIWIVLAFVGGIVGKTIADFIIMWLTGNGIQ